MLSQCFPLSLRKRPKRRAFKMTMEDRDRGDIAFEERLTRGDCEGLMIEQGEVVGATAVVTENKTIQSTEGKLPKGMVPSFVNDEAKIITAANCTVLLVCDFTNKTGSVTRHWGTAFFISPTHLLTAAHICSGDTPNAKLKHLFIVHPPGLHFVNYTALATDKLTTIDCTIVGTVYGQKQSYTSMNDIAILHAGSIKVPNYLPLSTTLPPEGAAVNVIGYPGHIPPKWISMQPGIIDTDAGRKAAEILLPERQLTISQGKVIGTGPLISYDLSTCPGMSGACVLYNDQIVGVHVGEEKLDDPNCKPIAVSFTGDTIREVFEKAKLGKSKYIPHSCTIFE